MRAVIIYISVHHGNTKQVAQAMAQELGAELIDLQATPEADLTQYDLVGVASGVYYGGLHKEMTAFLEKASLPKGQKFFFAATCGMAYRDYARAAKRLLAQKGAECLGSFQCRGFDTFGPFGKIGGIAKGHPNQEDLDRARAFARQMAQKGGAV